jgi:hypothetical protein
VAWAAARVPLASDLSAPLAFRASEARDLAQVVRLGVLQSSLRETPARLFTLQPYTPGAIPVVFVHGLNSSPLTWLKDANALYADPVLRRRYQFWFFFYPTGQPVPLSARQLREALHGIRDDLDPARRDPALDRMVLVGHSMGGLLAKMQVQDSGTRLWDAIVNVPYDQFQASPQTEGLLKPSLVYDRVPTVARVVFVATPHKGSPVADGWPGKLVGLLARPNPTVRAAREELVERYGCEAVRNLEQAQGFSILNLETDSMVLRTIDTIPIAPDVPYHTIALKRPCRDTDGVVPLWSSIKEGATSEIVVRSRHVAHEVPDVIAEIRRILHEHLAVSAGPAAVGLP